MLLTHDPALTIGSISPATCGKCDSSTTKSVSVQTEKVEADKAKPDPPKPDPHWSTRVRPAPPAFNASTFPGNTNGARVRNSFHSYNASMPVNTFPTTNDGNLPPAFNHIYHRPQPHARPHVAAPAQPLPIPPQAQPPPPDVYATIASLAGGVRLLTTTVMSLTDTVRDMRVNQEKTITSLTATVASMRSKLEAAIEGKAVAKASAGHEGRNETSSAGKRSAAVNAQLHEQPPVTTITERMDKAIDTQPAMEIASAPDHPPPQRDPSVGHSVLVENVGAQTAVIKGIAEKVAEIGIIRDKPAKTIDDHMSSLKVTTNGATIGENGRTGVQDAVAPISSVNMHQWQIMDPSIAATISSFATHEIDNMRTLEQRGLSHSSPAVNKLAGAVVAEREQLLADLENERQKGSELAVANKALLAIGKLHKVDKRLRRRLAKEAKAELRDAHVRYNQARKSASAKQCKVDLLAAQHRYDEARKDIKQSKVNLRAAQKRYNKVRLSATYFTLPEVKSE